MRLPALSFALALSACTRIYHIEQASRARPLYRTAINVELVTNPSASGAPALCIEAPSGWGVLLTTFAGEVDGQMISGTGTLQENLAKQMRRDHGRAEATWSCWSGPNMDYDARAHGKVDIFLDVPNASGTFELRYASGNLGGILPYGPILTRKVSVLTLDDHLDYWAAATSAFQFDERLHAVAHGRGVWVAVSVNDLALRSTDGLTWSSVPSGTVEVLEAVTFGQGKFVAAGGGAVILSSADGTAWAPENSGLSGEIIYDITYGNGIFVAPHSSGGVLTSTDGIAWTDRLTPVGFDLYGVARGPNRWVVTGAMGTIIYSSDGRTWEQATSPTMLDLRAVAYGGGIFLAVGDEGTALTSADGISWTARATDTTEPLEDVAFGNGIFLAVSRGDSGVVLSSRDGVTWSRHEAGTHHPLLGVDFAEDRWVIAGETGLIVTSAIPRVTITGALEFGVVKPGEESIAQTFTIGSAGRASLSIGTVALTGPDAEHFRLIDANGCASRSLPPSMTCQGGVLFEPETEGAKTATLAITTNDPDRPVLSIALSGVGGSEPEIEVSDSSGEPDDLSIAIGRVIVGMNVAATITITNRGMGPLMIGRIGGVNPLEAPFSIPLDQCGMQTLDAGASCELDVLFAPIEAGTFNDVFDISSNDLDESQILIGVRASAEAPPTVECTGAPPSPPVLIGPADGATEVSPPINLEYQPSSEAAAHELSICERADFSNCAPITLAGGPETSRLTLAALLAACSLGLMWRRRRIWATSALLAVLAACSGGGDDTKRTYTISDPKPGTKYYWKVTAIDAEGCRRDSEVRSFTTRAG